ncbi:MAG: hypothetical protein ABI949_01980 [Ilumatobacteraceae bacterium]
MTDLASPEVDPHERAHQQGFTHSHSPSSEETPRGGPVVMDIGGDIGGLIVWLDDSLEGTELPIECSKDPLRDIHTGVWRRAIGAETVVVAVYPELREGTYRIHSGDHHAGAQLQITGGQIAELDLRH